MQNPVPRTHHVRVRTRLGGDEVLTILAEDAGAALAQVQAWEDAHDGGRVLAAAPAPDGTVHHARLAAARRRQSEARP